ncbi:MAG: acylneuraminate cytidylyltransferase family protein [Phycisphaerae bacterium]|nr:acylneuraminate cytidylyltransferase family protein [Phycisphaerae bacterium]
MHTLAVIMARAGSKGLPDKCSLPLCGRPLISYTIGHAQEARLVNAIVLTTDSASAKSVAQAAGIQVIDRPAELAGDSAAVVDTVRHAVETYERQTGQQVDAVVILYGNIPVRAPGVVDRCVDHLVRTGCDSVRTVAPVTKQHPDWIHRLEGDKLVQFRPNTIHRRQDLEPLYYHDGAVIAVKRDSLFTPEAFENPHGFFGRDRRAIVQTPEDAVDVDARVDLFLAEAILRARGEGGTAGPPTAAGRRPPFAAGAVHAVAHDE